MPHSPVAAVCDRRSALIERPDSSEDCSGHPERFVMAAKSAIEWTESTWNPLTGCTKISPGCKHCYAERMSFRLKAMGQANYANGFKLTLHEHMLEVPLRWKKPRLVFVNSMSDLFHKDAPDEFIFRVFGVMQIGR